MPSCCDCLGEGGEKEMKGVGNQNKRQKDAMAINWTVSLFKKPFESDRERKRGIDRVGRVPRERPDNENSYLSFSLYQAKAMRETGTGGSFITVDHSIAWRVWGEKERLGRRA